MKQQWNRFHCCFICYEKLINSTKLYTESTYNIIAMSLYNKIVMYTRIWYLQLHVHMCTHVRVHRVRCTHLVARRLCDGVGHLEAGALHAAEEGAVDGACRGWGGKGACMITIRGKLVYQSEVSNGKCGQLNSAQCIHKISSSKVFMEALYLIRFT